MAASAAHRRLWRGSVLAFFACQEYISQCRRNRDFLVLGMPVRPRRYDARFASLFLRIGSLDERGQAYKTGDPWDQLGLSGLVEVCTASSLRLSGHMGFCHRPLIEGFILETCLPMHRQRDTLHQHNYFPFSSGASTPRTAHRTKRWLARHRTLRMKEHWKPFPPFCFNSTHPPPMLCALA